MRVSFLIVGAQKGGTTALYRFLSDHPRVGRARKKELHFFDSIANPTDYQAYHEQFVPVPSAAVYGEATPSYMYYKPAAERIRDYNPAMRLIFILRNPIERAYSNYAHLNDKDKEWLPFSVAIRVENLRQAVRWSRQHAYVDRGFYTRQINHMLRFFPREQMLFLKTEELRNHHTETINRVCDFIGVEPLNHTKPATIHSRSYPPMSPRDKKLLQRKFAGEIKDLERLLEWDCSDWLN